jgi:Lipopolysaccharide kinase (Kdo/WaaP) family
MTLPCILTNSGSGAERDGYVSLDVPGCHAVAREWAAQAVGRVLNSGSLYTWASRQPVRHEMQGRGIVYAVDLPTTPVTPVVVRRNSHGGLLQAVTGEYFLLPTRAPQELATALRLVAAGIPTPEVIAYAVYPCAGIVARSDVMTRRLPMGNDAPAAWKKGTPADREAILVAIAGLLKAMAGASAWHSDLNLKNVYITTSDTVPIAYLLDVDRVTFPVNSDVAGRNFTRLARSIRKWRTRWGLDFDEAALAQLAVLAEENK